MRRRISKSEFLRKIAGLNFALIGAPLISFAESAEASIEPKRLLLNAARAVPNSKFDLLLYNGIIPADKRDGAEYLERLFSKNGWPPMWRWQLFGYAHYHPNTHECVGVARGSATVQLGGDDGPKMAIKRGDVAVIPAGVGHKQISASADFLLVGAYPPGMAPDVYRDDPALMESARLRISKVPMPKTDPVNGAFGGLLAFWKK